MSKPRLTNLGALSIKHDYVTISFDYVIEKIPEVIVQKQKLVIIHLYGKPICNCKFIFLYFKIYTLTSESNTL